MTTLIFFLFGLLWLIGYSLYIALMYGIQPSFSDSYYKAGHLFTVTMGVLTFAFIMPLMDATEGQWWQFVSLLTIAPIAFVGVAAAFKDGGLTERVHMVSAWLSAIASLVWLILATIYINPWTIISVPFAALIAYLGYLIDEKKNVVWWAEYACFGWTIGGIAIALWL